MEVDHERAQGLSVFGFIFSVLGRQYTRADCSALPEWKRQHYYLLGDQVQYQLMAYVNAAESSKRDTPDPAEGACQNHREPVADKRS